ncbi:hypothetical protein Ciccas_000382 [Cichlidogyrus casuarinus]|uniref:Uncharacterized protein n=1 Tax=Cichlidogyrus casuarinus TaxID=1844966 RepID=A0ABD2QQE1_9PLAT
MPLTITMVGHKVVITTAVVTVATVTTSLLVFRLLFHRKGYHSRNRLQNKLAIVTGPCSSLGRDCCIHLARRGATVIMAGTSLRDMQIMKEEMLKLYGPTGSHKRELSNFETPIYPDQLILRELNPSSFESIYSFYNKFNSDYESFNYLMHVFDKRTNELQKSVDGLELQMATNHYGQMILYELMLPSLKNWERRNGGADMDTRIVMVTNDQYKKGKVGRDSKEVNQAYADSKLANVLYGQFLADRLTSENSKIQVFSVKPDQAHTGPMRCLLWLIGRSPIPAIENILHCLIGDKLVSGSCYENLKPVPLNLINKKQQAQITNADMKAIETCTSSVQFSHEMHSLKTYLGKL